MPWKKSETGVVHFISTKIGFWSKIVSEETQLDEAFLKELAQLGGVYLNNCRVYEDCEIKPDHYLRLHTDPRRYNLIPLQDRIIFENDDLIALDKPAGLPCHATVDNAQENILVGLQTQLQKTVLLTHRLDVPTSGILIFAKNQAAQAHFHQLLKDRHIEKFYEAGVEKPGPAIGFYEHHMVKSRYAPKIVQDTATDETQVCQLKILAKEDTPDYVLLRIELLTGRTHQIRAQLGHIGFPIWGDTLYQTLSTTKPEEENIRLRCVELRFPWHQEKIVLKAKSIKEL